MGSATVKFATWNIGGGILGESHRKGADPSLDHHVSTLEKYAPDVVCLQEAHDYQGRAGSQSDDLARRANYPYVASFPLSESHLAKDARLTLGILSRFPVREVVGKKFPNLGLAATGPSGDRWRLADKGYVAAVVELGDRELGVVNAHCFPLHYFGASPVEARFAGVWEMLAEDLVAISAARPALAGIDLNHGPVRSVLGTVLRPGGYRTAFEDTATTPKGVQQDHILYDSSVRLLTTTVAATRSDHSYCQASFLV